MFDDVVANGWVDHDPQNPFPDATGPAGAKKTMEHYRAAFPGGQIAETWTYWDTLGMLQQLGAVPAPAAHA